MQTKQKIGRRPRKCWVDCKQDLHRAGISRYSIITGESLHETAGNRVDVWVGGIND